MGFVTSTELLRDFMETPAYADWANQLPMPDLYAICELSPVLSLDEIQDIRSTFPTRLLYSQEVYLDSLMNKRLKAAPGGYNRVIGSVGHLKQGYTRGYGLSYVHKG